MDKITHYRQIMQQVLEQYAHKMSHGNQVKILPIFDTQHDQYLLISLGWSNKRREHAIVFHAQLQNSQILIEDDRTEEGFSTEFIAAGVSENDILLMWQSSLSQQQQLPLVA